MEGFIVNTDRIWFEFILKSRIASPVFWFKRETNPNSRALVSNNYIFFRITNISPPSIRAYGIISNPETLDLQKAFNKYGSRLGYASMDKMIEYSSRWTSTIALTPETKIFCVEILNFKIIEPIRVDTDLQAIGIVFDYKHIVTGKGLESAQNSALLQLATRSSIETEEPSSGLAEVGEEEITDYDQTDTSARFLESHLQWFVFNNLSCLGIPGIRLYDEEIQRESQGKYRTEEVGEIDLLLTSPNNEMIVVELKKSGTDKTIGQICRYMGWVKRRLAHPGQKVHGLIVTQDYDHRLAYAASVIPDLTVKKVSISFNITTGELDLP